MHPLRLIRVREVHQPVAGVKTLVLDPQQVGDYEAGQYINLVHPKSEGRLVRSYSFSSCPETDPHPAICFKRIPNGRMSRYLFDEVQVGDHLLAKGVQGLFSLPSPLSDENQLFFFAAGIGITPIISMIKSALAQNFQGNVVLVYANSSRETTLFYEELKDMAQAHPDQFVLDMFFSSNKDLLRARLNKQVLEGLVPRFTKTPRERMLFYTCGPHAFMRMIQFGLIEQGFAPEQIRREHFHTQVGVQVHLPDDQGEYEVHLEWKGKNYSFPSQYPSTILQSARKVGLDLPFSCEVGMCGSCMAYRREGNVWHRQNELLTDKDLREGMVLTCVAYPQGGPLILTDRPLSEEEKKQLKTK